MTTFKKWLPWILLVIAAGAAVYVFTMYNKEKEKNQAAADATTDPTNTGIAGGLIEQIDASALIA